MNDVEKEYIRTWIKIFANLILLAVLAVAIIATGLLIIALVVAFVVALCYSTNIVSSVNEALSVVPVAFGVGVLIVGAAIAHEVRKIRQPTRPDKRELRD